MHLEPWQWILIYACALLTGISKTAVPGSGILVVNILAQIFGGRASVGVMLPMLLLCDVFAVGWYWRDAQVQKLVKVVPGVLTGLAIGVLALWLSGRFLTDIDVLGKLIGFLTLLMLMVHVLKNKLHERLAPTSPIGIAFTGIFAGFSTTVSNAGGPVMSIYLAAYKMPKKEFVGTLAWFFLIMNLAKLPIYIYLSAHNTTNPIITAQSALLAIYTLPALAIGALAGKLVLPKISQKGFEAAVLILAGAGAVKLLIK